MTYTAAAVNGPLTLAESIYCSHLAGRTALDAEIEELCRRHPDLAVELRACHLQHEAARTALSLALPRSAADRYEVVRELGRGGMGVVMEARDGVLRRHVALKVQRDLPEAGGLLGLVLRERARTRMISEAQILAQLHHPGMVPVHDIGTDGDGRSFFTMLLVKGRHFGKVIEDVHRRDAKWSLARAVGVLQRACATIAFAHARGVVHRDLKPENIMVGEEGQVFVLDWGLAAEPGERHAVSTERQDLRARVPDSPVLTAAGEVVGTPAYMAPEQAGGATATDPRVDVYGAGAILYHLLVGARPYAEVGDLDPLALVHRVRAVPPRSLHAAARRMPVELVAIARRAMSRDVDQRYPDMAAMAADLQSFLELRTVAAWATGPWSELRAWLRRNALAAGVLAASVLIAGAALAWIACMQTAAAADVRRANEQQAAATFVARSAAREAENRASEVLLPADEKRLADLLMRNQDVGPADPDHAAAIAAWLEDADTLLARRPRHAAALASVRDRARDPDRARREEARRAAVSDELGVARNALERAFASLQQMPGDRARQAAVVAAAEAVEALRGQVGTGTGWEFGIPADQWQHDALVRLTAGLDALAALAGRERLRLRHAATVFARSLGDEAPRRDWHAAIDAIAGPGKHQTYRGLRIEPQLGLVPIGFDPRSGLAEFAHLESGEVPTRDAAGRLRIGEEHGLVFVLVPGGDFAMGSQSQDPGGANFDPSCDAAAESPVHRVSITSFFLSKFEMTQAQLLRVAGANPSYFAPSRNHEVAQPVSLLHPVGMLSGREAESAMHRLGLRLPADEEWEYGARAGSSTVFATGDAQESLFGYANVADAAFRRAGPMKADAYAEFDDGWSGTAPVGSFAPNAFGLHDVHGNATEYARARDPENWCVLRGGGAFYPPGHARAACRLGFGPGFRWATYGVRPARSIEGGVRAAR